MGKGSGSSSSGYSSSSSKGSSYGGSSSSKGSTYGNNPIGNGYKLKLSISNQGYKGGDLGKNSYLPRNSGINGYNQTSQYQTNQMAMGMFLMGYASAMVEQSMDLNAKGYGSPMTGGCNMNPGSLQSIMESYGSNPLSQKSTYSNDIPGKSKKGNSLLEKLISGGNSFLPNNGNYDSSKDKNPFLPDNNDYFLDEVKDDNTNFITCVICNAPTLSSHNRCINCASIY